jgi:hypothetical protein
VGVTFNLDLLLAGVYRELSLCQLPIIIARSLLMLVSYQWIDELREFGLPSRLGW